MLEKLYNVLMVYSIYGDSDRKQYFSAMLQDKIEPNENDDIDIFKWVFDQKDPKIFTRALGTFTENARKYLIENRSDKAKILFKQYMAKIDQNPILSRVKDQIYVNL